MTYSAHPQPTQFETKAFVYCPICTHTVEGGQQWQGGESKTGSEVLPVFCLTRSWLHHAARSGSVTCLVHVTVVVKK
jgi:hypothetical protein